MERTLIDKLVEWKDSPRRKPLIIEGARQVGKTWLVKHFASMCFEDIAYINFEEQPYLKEMFGPDFDIGRIIGIVNGATRTTVSPGKTLIFFDEIQEAPNGITAMKYFCENGAQYHVVAAGSLLGVQLHRQSSFPVGKVQFLTLYPMSFLEFLMAIDEKSLARIIQEK